MGTQSSCLFTSLALRDCSNSLHQFGVFRIQLASDHSPGHSPMDRASSARCVARSNRRPRRLSSHRIGLVGSLHRLTRSPCSTKENAFALASLVPGLVGRCRIELVGSTMVDCHRCAASSHEPSELGRSAFDQVLGRHRSSEHCAGYRPQTLLQEKMTYQQQFALAKLHLLDPGRANLCAFMSLTPQALGRVRHQLAQHDSLRADNPQLDEALAWLGVQSRLVRSDRLYWKNVDRAAPLLELDGPYRPVKYFTHQVFSPRANWGPCPEYQPNVIDHPLVSGRWLARHSQRA